MSADNKSMREQEQSVMDALWIRDQWLRECHDRIRLLNAVLQEFEIEHEAMLNEDEVLPGEIR